MNQNFKRFMAGLMAFMTVLTSVYAGGEAVSAASASASLSLYYASARSIGVVSELKPGYDHGKMLYGIIDGNSGYCMNYGKSADGGQTMTSSETMSTVLSAEQEKLLHYCMYYGFNATSDTDPTNEQRDGFIATQAMVWIITENKYGTAEGDSAARKFCNSAPDKDASYQYYETLKSNIDASYYAERPSFSSQTMSGAETYELNWNETNQRFETTLTDANGVMDHFDISLSGYDVSVDGDQVTISSAAVNTTDTIATMTSNTGAVETKTGCIYWLTGKDGYQEFISTRPTADPVSGYFNVRTESIGYGEIIKEDDKTGTKLEGAVYGIYSDSGCSSLVDTLTTGPDGRDTSEALVAGTYYVKEITAPTGYVRSDKVHTLTITPGQTTTITVKDQEQLGAITIYKEGEVLTGWNGSNFTYEKRNLPGANFKVTAGEDIYRADGAKVYNKGETVAQNLISGSDGQVLLTGLHFGTYVVTEAKSINGYTLNTDSRTVKIHTTDQNVAVKYESTTIYNNRQKAEVSVMKMDSLTNNPLDGGRYTIYAGNDIVNYDGRKIVTKGTALQTVTTGEDGRGDFSVDLPIANGYYVSETQAPYAYTRNEEEVYQFEFGYLPETTAKKSFSHTFANDRTTAKIRIYKVDKELVPPLPQECRVVQRAMAQGDGTLEGAVYGLYAREDIHHPDGATGVMYHAGDLVTTLTTDEYGEAEVDGLYLGRYYVKELTPSEGYLLDEDEYDIECDYEGDLVAEVEREVISREQVIKQPFQLIKISDNGEDTENGLLAGAGFQVYLKSKLPVKKDGTYDFENAEPIIITEDGEREIFSNELGHVVTIPIPYGTYVVIESTTPADHTTIQPFEVKIVKNNPTVPQVWRVFSDREFTAKLKIVKKDGDTGKTVLVPNAEFKIYDMDNKEYVTMVTTYPSKVTHTSFFTDEDGDLILPEVLGLGNYRIEEVKAPVGYALNQDYVEVAVSTDTFYEVDADTLEAIIEVDYVDEPVVGELTVEKIGEGVVRYGHHFLEKSLNKDFVYDEMSLAGAKYEVYAAEDIYTADMQTDGNGDRIKYYSKGELVATLVTGEDGTATLSDLPLGQYKVAEVEAPYGHVLNEEEQTITFTYVDDKTPVIYGRLTFENERQKAELSVLKTDAETKEPLSGAVFGLYAKEDILNWYGDVMVDKGTLLETAVSDDRGEIRFVKDYPFGTYEAREMEIPAGYASTEETVVFEVEYKGQDQAVVSYTGEIENVPTTFEFTKTDITSGAELTGAQLTVFDKEGNVIDSWTSSAEEAHVIKRLVVGETYTLREEFAPYGYLKAEDVEFTVEDTGEIQSVKMEDDVPTGVIFVNKDGEFLTDAESVEDHWYDFIFQYFKESMSGVTFDLYAAEDIVSPDGLDTVYYEKDQLVTTIVTNDKGIAGAADLPLGRYYLVETKTLDSFVLDPTPIEADILYVDQFAETVFAGSNVTNERQKVEIKVIKKNLETEELLSGAVYGLYTKEDILNKDGDAVVKADTMIERGMTGEDGTFVFVSDLPLGKYYVKELAAPEGYATSDEVFELDATYQGPDKEVIKLEAEFRNAPIKVEFSKTDITGEVELEGAVLSVFDVDGNLIETWTSEKEPHMIERLPAGGYILREELAPYGFLKATDVKFTVEDTGEVQKVAMKDEVPTGTIIINKDGEFLTDVEKAEDHWYDFIFRYFTQSLAGVTFDVYAAENVVSPDGRNTVYYEKDQLVATIITDEKGIAKVEELPLGRYYLVETATLEGFVLDPIPVEADLTYIDQDTEVVYAGMNITNERQKVEIKVVKKDGETKETLRGAVFGLYNKEDIQNKDGKVIVAAGTLIERGTTDENGSMVFQSDLPLGKYYVKELEAPEGYAGSEEIFEVEAVYQEVEKTVLQFEAEFFNAPIKVEFSKTDMTGEHELEGAVLTVLNEKGETVESWISGKEAHMIERLPAGKYILREETAPFGYVIANDVEFEVMETGEIQKVSMKDEAAMGKIILMKKSENGSPLEGARFGIFDKDGNQVGSLVTDKNGRTESELLPIAVFADGEYKEMLTYRVLELEAPQGYVLDPTVHEVEFEYQDGKESVIEVVLNVTNQPVRTDRPKTGDNSDPWMFAVVGLAALGIGAAVLFTKKKPEEEE